MNIGRMRGHVATVAPRCIFAVSIVMAFPHHVVEAPGLQRIIMCFFDEARCGWPKFK